MSAKKRTRFWAVSSLSVLVLSMLITIFAVTPVFAANEQLEYDSPPNGNTPPNAIIISGGSNNIAPQKLTRVPDTNDYEGTVKVTDQCTYSVKINVDDGNPGTGQLGPVVLGNEADPTIAAACAPRNNTSPTAQKQPFYGSSGTVTIAAFGSGPTTQPTCTAPYTYSQADKICRAPLNPDGTCPPPGTKVDGGTGAGATSAYCQAGTGNAQTPGTTDPATEEPDPCPIGKDTSLRWLACPTFEMANTFTKALDDFLEEYLSVGNTIFDGTNPSYQKAWSTFRNFGIGLVVIAGLVMVISEALGLGILDAYTVRKVAPRLFIAVVGISLSWSLMAFVVGFFDDLGHAIGSIIYNSFNVQPKDVSVASVILASWFGAPAAGFGAWAILGAGGLLSFVGTLMLAMLVGALVLIARQAIIVAAIILAPLAIAAYVLPNTSKFAKFWWDTLIRMLMLYPIAIGIIALCKVMGKLTFGVDKIGSTIAGFIFFFAGYALLPLAFRLTGGLVATLGGIANDRTRGGFDRLKNYRKGRSAANIEAMKAGGRFNGGNALSRGFNATTFRAGTKRFGLGGQGRQAMSDRRSILAAQHAKSDAGQAAQFNDNLLRAQSYRSADEARKNMAKDFNMKQEEVEEAITMAKGNGGFSQARSVYATKQLAATGTGYDDLGQMSAAIARAANGNEGSVQDMVGSMRGMAKQSGRHDLGGAGHGTVAKLASTSMANGNARPSESMLNDALVEAARSTDNASLVRGKPIGTAQMSHALNEALEKQTAIIRNPESTQIQITQASQNAAQLTAKIRNMQNATTYGPEVSAEAMHEGKEGKAHAVTGEKPVYTGFASPPSVNNVELVQTIANTKNGGVIQIKDDRGVAQPRVIPTEVQQATADKFNQQINRGVDNPSDINRHPPEH